MFEYFDRPFFRSSNLISLRRLQNILGSICQKWISQNSAKGDPLGRQGVESLMGRGVLNAPLVSEVHLGLSRGWGFDFL